jgi:hypothetical protein
MLGALQVAQRNNDFAWLQPCRVIGVEVGKHDQAGAIEEVSSGYWQHPTIRSVLRRIGETERPVSGPELLGDGEGDAIARTDFTFGILQYRERQPAVAPR